MEGEHTVLMGDFNFVMDLDLDKAGGSRRTNVKCRDTLQNWMQENNLYDIWRVKHPHEKVNMEV